MLLPFRVSSGVRRQNLKNDNQRAIGSSAFGIWHQTRDFFFAGTEET